MQINAAYQRRFPCAICASFEHQTYLCDELSAFHKTLTPEKQARVLAQATKEKEEALKISERVQALGEKAIRDKSNLIQEIADVLNRIALPY